MTDNPVLDYFNMPENKNKNLSTKTISKQLNLNHKTIFYYILNNDNFERVEPLAVGYRGNTTRVFRIKNELDQKRFDSNKLHTVCRKSHPQYPQRTLVLNHRVTWNVSWPKYNPVRFTHVAVLNNERGKGGKWADPVNKEEILLPGEKWNEGTRKSFDGIYVFDRNGYPRNPKGRTGIFERGLLGKWGPNHTADPIVTRYDPKRENQLQVIVIKRADTGEWALPGGMVDRGESVSVTVRREFEEEAGNLASVTDKELFNRLTDELFASGKVVYQGYVDDLRNTDNAWLETTAYHFHCNPEIAKYLPLSAGDDAKDVKWMDIDDKLNLHANHTGWVKRVASNM